MNVAMRGVPEAGLVIEDVILLPAVPRQSPGAHDVLDPTLLIQRAVLHIGVVGIVTADRLIGGFQNSVSGVGEPLSVVAGLRAVFGLRETGQLGAAGAQLRYPSNHGDGDHGLRAARPAVGYERVSAF